MNNQNQKSSAETLYQPFLIFYKMPQKQIAYFTSRLKQPCYQFAQMEINCISANSGFSISIKLLPTGSSKSTRPLLAKWEMGTKGAAQLPFPAHVPYLTPAWKWDKPPSTSEAKPLLSCPCCPQGLCLYACLCAEVMVLCAGPQAVQVTLDPSIMGEATLSPMGCSLQSRLGVNTCCQWERWEHARSGDMCGFRAPLKTPAQVRETGIEGVWAFISSLDPL